MSNEMNRDTYNEVVALAYDAHKNLGTVNGAAPSRELTRALNVLVSFAAENETGVEDFHDTLTQLSAVVANMAEAVMENPKWDEWMLQDADPTEEQLHQRCARTTSHTSHTAQMAPSIQMRHRGFQQLD